MNTFERCIDCTGERAELCKPFRDMAVVHRPQTPAARLDSNTELEAFELFRSLLAQRLGEIGCAHYSPQKSNIDIDVQPENSPPIL